GRARRSGPDLGRTLRGGKRESKNRAAVFGRLEPHTTTVRLRETRRDRETEPHARSRIGRLERIEDQSGAIWWDAWAMVAHADHELAIGGADVDFDRVRRRRKLGRVLEQIDEH